MFDLAGEKTPRAPRSAPARTHAAASATAAPGKRPATSRLASAGSLPPERMASGLVQSARQRLDTCHDQDIPALERAVQARDEDIADRIRSRIRVAMAIARSDLADAEALAAALSWDARLAIEVQLAAVRIRLSVLEAILQDLEPVTPASEGDAIAAMWVAADILANRRRDYIAGAPAAFRSALVTLHRAVAGRKGTGAGAGDRQADLDRALYLLGPARAAVAAADPDWLAEHIDPYLNALRREAATEAARARVDRALLAPDGSVVEPPDSELTPETAREHARALVPAVDGLLRSIKLLNKVAMNLDKRALEAATAEMRKMWDSGMLRMERLDMTDLLSLESALVTIQGLLKFPETWSLFAAATGLWAQAEAGVALVQMAIETIGGGLTLACQIGARVLMLCGNQRVATYLSGLGGAAILKIGSILNVVDALHGTLMLLNGEIEGLRGAAAGGSWMILKGIGVAGKSILKMEGLREGTKQLARRLVVLGRAAGPTSILATVGYYEGVAVMMAYGKISSDLVTAGLMPRFERMAYFSSLIARGQERVHKAAELAERESDPEKKRALEQVVAEAARDLSATVSSFLAECERSPSGMDRTRPGENPHLRLHFSRLAHLKGVTDDPHEALERSNATLSAIREALEQAASFVERSMDPDKTRAAAAAAEERP